MSSVTVITGEIQAIGKSLYPDITALELSCMTRPGLTYQSVGLKLGPEVIGKTVRIELATVPRDKDDPRLDYITAVTVGNNEPDCAVYNQTRWVELFKTRRLCKEYDFPWIRSYFGE
jgi:hypothetical protein